MTPPTEPRREGREVGDLELPGMAEALAQDQEKLEAMGAFDTDAAGYPIVSVPELAAVRKALRILREVADFQFSTLEKKHGYLSALKSFTALKRRCRLALKEAGEP